MLTPGPTETAPAAHVAGVPPKLARIGAGLILLLGALTAIGPFTIDLYLAAFPQITVGHGHLARGRPTHHHRHPGRVWRSVSC